MAKDRKKNWNQEYSNHDSGRLTRSKSQAQKKFIDSVGNGTNDDEFPVLKKLGLYASSIKGDGNCLFRSLSDQYYGDNGDKHQEVRAEVVNYMKEHADYFALFLEGSESGGESWPAYIKRMARDGVYGDNLEIVAFARKYGANVMIYQNDFMNVVSCGDKDGDSEDIREVHIAYHTWEHYSSVRNSNGPHRGLPVVKPLLVEGDIDSTSTASNDIPSWQIEAVKRSIPYPSTDEVERLIVRLLKKHNSSDISRTVEEIIMMDDGNGELVIKDEVAVRDDDSVNDLESREEIIDNVSVAVSVTVAVESNGKSTLSDSVNDSENYGDGNITSFDRHIPNIKHNSLSNENEELNLSNINGKRQGSLLSKESTASSRESSTEASTGAGSESATEGPSSDYIKSTNVVHDSKRATLPKRLTAREKKERQKKEAAERKRALKMKILSDRSRSTTAAISDASAPSTTPSTPGIRTMYI